MKKYYHADKGQQAGPYTLEELKLEKISKFASVWTEGMNDWAPAHTLPELATLFPNDQQSPPPLPGSSPPPIPDKNLTFTRKKKKSYKPVLIVLAVLFSVILASIIIDIINTAPEPTSKEESLPLEEPVREKTPEELRAELREKERWAPLNYLSVTFNTWKENFWGEDIVKGSVDNSASLAGYKDIVLKITWLAKTGTELGNEQHIIYEHIYPNSSIPFKIKTQSPGNAQKIRVEVVRAKPD